MQGLWALGIQGSPRGRGVKLGYGMTGEAVLHSSYKNAPALSLTTCLPLWALLACLSSVCHSRLKKVLEGRNLV